MFKVYKTAEGHIICIVTIPGALFTELKLEDAHKSFYPLQM